MKAAVHGMHVVQMVERQFESLFPGKVLRVHMAHDVREIDSLVSEYWRLRRKLLDQLDDYSEQRKRLQPVKPAQACHWLHTLCVKIPLLAFVEISCALS